MLTLILFRHAKSDWRSDNGNDRERPLAQRGIRAARTMGGFLASSGQVPQLALTSPAVRARNTLELAKRQGNWSCPAETHKALYDNDADGIIKYLRGLEKLPKSLLITSHEPAMSELVSKLIGGSSRVRFPTAAMARIDLAINHWHELRADVGELRWLVPPKVFRTSVRFESEDSDND